MRVLKIMNISCQHVPLFVSHQSCTRFVERKYLSSVESLEEEIRITRPHILLSNVESLTSPDIQRRISKLQISYIAVDEAQLLGPLQMS